MPSAPNDPLTANEAFAALSEFRPDNAIVVQETPSNKTPSNSEDLLKLVANCRSCVIFYLRKWWSRLDGPAAVGIALARQKSASGRAVIAFIGDGSFQYSIQSLYTAAQHGLRLIYIVLCNDEYAILKEFAILENTPNVPALDLPGLDIVSSVKGFGCIGVQVKNEGRNQKSLRDGTPSRWPTVIAIPIKREFRPLVG